jgi:Lipocalin-like domain
MLTRPVISMVLLCVMTTAGAQSGNAQTPSHALVGAWRFVRYETWDAAGTRSTPFGQVPSGYIVFDSNGLVMIQLSTRVAPNTPEDAINFGAYYGSYTIDPRADTVRIKVEGANFAGYTGTTQVRPFRISNDTLYLGVPREYQATLVRVRPERR